MTAQPTLDNLADQIKAWGLELGFQQVAIADTDLSAAAERLRHWLKKDYQGDMGWLAEHGDKRWRPEKLGNRPSPPA